LHNRVVLYFKIKTARLKSSPLQAVGSGTLVPHVLGFTNPAVLKKGFAELTRS